MTAKDECGRCRFFVLRKDKAGAAGGGFCRRFPPAFPAGLVVTKSEGWLNSMPVAYEVTLDDNYTIDGWPFVIKGSWCGEFSALVEERQAPEGEQ